MSWYSCKNLTILAAAAAKSLQSCLTLCYPIDGSPPGSPALGILQARIPEWVAISFSNAWKSRSVMSDSSQPHGLQPTRLFHPWDFLGKSTGVGCRFFLQRIFLTQGSNLGLPHCRRMLYRLSHQGSLGTQAYKKYNSFPSNCWNSLWLSWFAYL